MNDLIFWFDGPPVCCKGVFDAVAEQWKGRTFYVCTRAIDKDRAQIVSDAAQCECENGEKHDGKAECVFLNTAEDPLKFGTDFVREHVDDVHIFNGYKSGSSVFLDILIKMNADARIVVWAERPHYLRKVPDYIRTICEILNTMSHKRYAAKYQKHISAFLPLGNKGVEAYTRIGWQDEKVFPFLYVPELNEGIAPANDKLKSDVIKFIYLGRFSATGKGTDLLIDACRQLKGENYSLELVGGYGDYKEQTLKYVDENPHLKFGGTWPITEACDRLSDYDVCIVPSRLEGWNVTVNEALMAGIGCIVTEEAVSDELVSESGAGKIVKADSKAIADAMDEVMASSDIVSEWKESAYSYRPYMTAEACARYFIDIINYTFFDSNSQRPSPPWRIH